MTLALHPLGFESRMAELPTGHRYRYVDIHPPEGVKTIATALLLHGFPDSAYGWRHQVKGWSNRGIRLIIPDALGYTGTSQPLDPEEYSFKRQSDNYEALVQEIGLSEGEKIILIAHDWGAGTANRLAQFKPNLVKGVANLCVPFYKPAQQYVPIEKLVNFLPNFEYQLFFASPGSEAIIDANVEKFISLIYTSAKQVESGEVPSFEKKGVIEEWLKDDTKFIRPSLLSSEELNVIVTQIKDGAGFSNRKFNYDLEKDLPQDYRPEMPKLLIIPTADPAILAAMSANVEKEFQNIEVVRFEGSCGHWVQLERPDEIERIVGEWVERVVGKEWMP
ncbi:alpha/beta hydrolase family protein [Ceratobasidium sp. AG-Ba]|nr:alpha/beta hydrolase family protein [Ceratobasidium sp. AG-Ba]